MSKSKTLKIIVALIWAAIIVFALVEMRELSVEEILEFTPESPLLAALVIIFLFALKSLSFVMPSWLLYVSAGLIFPLPEALLVSLVGTLVSFTVPYVLGRGLGADYLEKLVADHPKLSALKDFSGKNSFLKVLLVRLCGLPLDPVSVYFGASRVNYPLYLIAGSIGILPHSVPYIVMGMSAEDGVSPAFFISLGIIAVSAVVNGVMAAKRKRRESAEAAPPEDAEKAQ